MRNLPPKMTHDETRELIVKAQHGSVAARNAAITGNMRLVASIAERAARAVGQPALVDDLIMAGAMGVSNSDGLLHAIMSFDPARGIRFSTYAHPYIREAVNKQLATLCSDIGSYKTRQTRTTIRNRARKLMVELGRPPSADEVHATLSKTMRRDVSVATVELALAPTGSETHDEPSAGGEDETIDQLRLVELREAAAQHLTPAQRDLLSRRYSGEELRGEEKIGADEAEAILREALT